MAFHGHDDKIADVIPSPVLRPGPVSISFAASTFVRARHYDIMPMGLRPSDSVMAFVVSEAPSCIRLTGSNNFVDGG